MKTDDNIMTVAMLIEHLKTFDQAIPVAFRRYSEHELMDRNCMEIRNLCEPRGDGWVHDARPDKPHTPYLVFLGN